MDALTELRERAIKFQVKDLAKRAELSRGYVCELLSGEKKNPSLNAYLKLEKAVADCESEVSDKNKQKKQTASRDNQNAAKAGKEA